MKDMTFTTLAQLKGFLSELNDEELGAETSIHDWYRIEIINGIFGPFYTIEGFEGGEE